MKNNSSLLNVSAGLEEINRFTSYGENVDQLIRV